ncbi:MAG: 30S ribosome-binding factor RbfA [Clostridia bacterium]|nr:30S ribosome-binding factor RbfA [Clostridia bacterium]
MGSSANKGKSYRVEKLSGEYRKEIYDIITRKVKDPFITEMFSILDVVVSRDLSHAKVYVSIYSKNEEKKNATFSAIKNNAKKIRKELAAISNIRTVPELDFVLDGSMEYGDNMDKLFKKIEQEIK